MAIIICPDCGKEQDNLNKFCRNCGADLSKVEVISEIDADSQEANEESVKEEIGETVVQSSETSEASETKPVDSINEENKESDVNKCSNCGTELKYGEKFCPNCGQSTNKVDENYPKNFCPDCGEKLSENAKFCPNCGFDLNNFSKNVHNKNANTAYNPQMAGQNLPARKEPIVSVILSFVFPGLGQFYNGHSTKGIYFIILAVVSIILTMILIGALIYLLVWLWSIIDAYNSAEKLNRGEFVEDKLF